MPTSWAYQISTLKTAFDATSEIEQYLVKSRRLLDDQKIIINDQGNPAPLDILLLNADIDRGFATLDLGLQAQGPPIIWGRGGEPKDARTQDTLKTAAEYRKQTDRHLQ